MVLGASSGGVPAWSALRGQAGRLFVAGELLFTLAFFGWTAMRSFSPDVRQTEELMDMAFVNAVDRSESFPPFDPWQSGENLNYYYFGHYLVAFLGPADRRRAGRGVQPRCHASA